MVTNSNGCLENHPGKSRFIYLLAASHSGSTLLAMLLGSHPDICTVGELKATSLGDPDNYLCSCRKNIKECPFWNGISQDMAKRGFSFDITNSGTDISSGTSRYVRKLLSPLHRGPVLEMLRDMALALSPNWRSNLTETQSLNQNLVECVSTRTGKKIIVDSSKIGIRLKYLLRNPGLDIKIIRLIRDGRGVALSYANPSVFADASDPTLRGGGTGNTYERDRNVKEAAREWLRCNEEAESILNRLDQSRWIKVHYENFCRDPEGELHKLFSFIGVDPDTRHKDFRSVEHHIIGNGMRLDTASEIRLDERWKTVLSAADIKTFNSIAGAMNRKLGYH